MRIETGNIFEVGGDAICITTNGFVNAKGEAVMGRGVAAQAAVRWPEIKRVLGNAIKTNGNICQRLGFIENKIIISFPVKPTQAIAQHDLSNVVPHLRGRYKPGDVVPGWASVAEWHIIQNSTRQLMELINKESLFDVKLPKPGCGAGNLDWEWVGPILAGYLDHRVSVIDIK